MNNRFRGCYSSHRRDERGSAAVELAFILPIFILLMTFTVFYARCFWHYTVAQKAAQAATRYLSQVSRSEMMSKTLTKNAAAFATNIARLEMAELAPGSTIDDPVVRCETASGILPCGSTVGELPTAVSVFITFGMFDNFFGVVDTGRFGLTITAESRMTYVGY